VRFDLDAIDAPAETGGPRLIALQDIDEDPEQPRSEFDEASLAELAATIAGRGVKQPVSVRPHPHDSGRWMLNFGARRLRAARLAGLGEIPAFVDETVDSYDQVIENEQREGLKPLELALFVRRRLALGENQAEIARRLGKSRQYVTLATALIDAPDWLLDLYRSGRCRGVTELYELRRLHAADPEGLQKWLQTQPTISRAELHTYKVDAGSEPTRPSRGDVAVEAVPATPGLVASQASSGGRPAAQTSIGAVSAQPGRRAPKPLDRVLVLRGQVDGVTVRILLGEPPPQCGHVRVELIEGAEQRVVPLARVEALQIIEVAA
jgi:ParB family chromosome partitioning protein